MINNQIVQYLNGVKDISFNIWMMYSVYNYVTYSLDPTFESLGQIVVIVCLLSILLGYMTGLNL